MNRLAVAALLLFPALADAQRAGAPPGTPDEIKRNLIRIEREIGQANFACDYQYFARVEADEFVFTDANGALTTKLEDLAGEKGCRRTERTYDLDSVKISLYGSVAVVTARTTISGKNADSISTNHRSRFTDVFVWRDGRWQLVAGHASRIPAPKPGSPEPEAPSRR